ncbi:S8 family serine peptidase [bacterium]|nr:S8 family serine peptidase [bacterium]
MKTHSVYSILIGILILCSHTIANDSSRIWITLDDRPNCQFLSTSQIYNLAVNNGLTQTAIERRKLEGLSGDSLVTLADLPPDPEYVEQIRQTGAKIRQQSCWFNAVSVEADEQALAIIKSLPFVKEVRPVLHGDIAGFSYEEVGGWDGYPSPGPGADGAGLYGPSYMQNLQVNAIEAHRLGYRGKGVLMLVLDSGFELSHEAYNQIDVFAQYDFVDDDDYPGVEPEDKRGQAAHGTGCLSAIAGYSPGNLIGIAHEASFVLAKTEDTRRETPLEEDNFIAAIEWAGRLGVSVLSASLSYKDWYTEAEYDGELPFISRGVDRARKLGILCTTAMSNEGPQPRTLGAPADAFTNLSCGAVDSTGKIARFSSRGPTGDGRIKPALCAMGVRTAIIRPFSEHNYSRWNGTSLSTPVLAGVLALVRGAHPDWSAKQCEEALLMTASQADHPDNIYGYGIPDAVAAINYPEIRLFLHDSMGNGLDSVQVLLNEADLGESYWAFSEKGIVSFANLPHGNWKYKILPQNRFIASENKLNGTITVPYGGNKSIELTE